MGDFTSFSKWFVAPKFEISAGGAVGRGLNKALQNWIALVSGQRKDVAAYRTVLGLLSRSCLYWFTSISCWPFAGLWDDSYTGCGEDRRVNATSAVLVVNFCSQANRW